MSYSLLIYCTLDSTIIHAQKLISSLSLIIIMIVIIILYVLHGTTVIINNVIIHIVAEERFLPTTKLDK